MKRIVIEKLGKNYCVLIVNKTKKEYVFYSQAGLTSEQAFFECRDVGLALKIALKHRDKTLFYTDINDAAARYYCDETELKKYEVQS